MAASSLSVAAQKGANGFQPDIFPGWLVQPTRTEDRCHVDSTRPDRHKGRFSFRRSNRLLGSRDFSRVFDKPDIKVSHKNLLILVRRNPGSPARLGLVVSKKNAPLAVERNRLKRIIREQFRLNQNKLEDLDLVVLIRPGLSKKTNQEINDIVRQQFEKTGNKKNA
jgi:ribonuclease P protein component